MLYSCISTATRAVSKFTQLLNFIYITDLYILRSNNVLPSNMICTEKNAEICHASLQQATIIAAKY